MCEPKRGSSDRASRLPATFDRGLITLRQITYIGATLPSYQGCLVLMAVVTLRPISDSPSVIECARATTARVGISNSHGAA